MFANDDFGGGIGRRRRPKKSLLLSLLSSHRGNSVIRMKTFQFNQKPSVANLAIETKHCNCDMITFFENKIKIQKNNRKIKTPGKGIYLYLNFKTHIPRGNKTVLKMYGKLIRAEIWKPFKKFLKIFWRLETFFLNFLGFYKSRSLQIRAVFFHTIKTRFYIEFRRYQRSLKCTPRYGNHLGSDNDL